MSRRRVELLAVAPGRLRVLDGEGKGGGNFVSVDATGMLNQSRSVRCGQ